MRILVNEFDFVWSNLCEYAIPECNKEFIKLFVAEYPLLLSPQQIPFKENLAFYISLIIKNQKEDKLGNIITLNHLSFIKTATDLLRFYAAISLSDITLTSKIKLITIDRKLRRLFLNVLENLTIKNEEAVINDLSRHEAHFKIVLEKLHVGEYASRYPIFFSVAKKFRNNQYQTYYSLLEQNRNNIDILLPLLESHPGEFARRLDAVIRNNPLYIDQILASFEHVAHKVSTNVLISLYNHFSNRITSLFSDRIFCVKTNKGIKYISKNDNRFNIKSETIDKIKLLIKETLKEKFASLPFINNVYLSPKLSAYGLIRNNRNTSKNHKTLTYGTRIKLPEAKTNFLRFFTHWKNIAKKDSKSSCRVDIDLSVSLIGNNPYSFRDLAWFNMSGGKNIDSFHSGDLTSAPNGASEFIDLNIEQARKKYCYALVSNIVYTGQSFSEIPECFSGVMFVNNLGKKGAVFNPKLVEQKFDLVQENTNQNIAFIVDLINLELIWVDIPNNVFINSSIDCYRGYLFNILQDALKNRLSVYDFFLLHEKHMNFVTNKEDAKFIIDEENADITPFDMEIISSQFM